MHRSRVPWLVAGAIVLFCLPAAATWSRWNAGSRTEAVEVAAVQLPESGADRTFRHGSHLAPDWHTTAAKDQFAKHCQVCHDFQKDAPLGLGSTVQRCASCHFSDPARKNEGHDGARLELQGGERLAGRVSAYDHSLPGHQARACAECHSWAPGPRGDFRHPDVTFTVPTSLAVCADCHHHGAEDPGAKWQQTVHKEGPKGAWRAAWDRATSCEECHKSGSPKMLDSHRRGKERLFEHSSHVPVADLGTASKSQSCAGCHAMAGDAVATMGVEQKSCATCHFTENGGASTTLVADLEVQRMPTLFSHGAKGHQEACSVCHPMANDASDPAVGRMYADCTTNCHSERRVPRHGQWSCDQCHAHKHPGTEDEARGLALTTVQRPVARSTFAFPGARHPGVTAGGKVVHPVADGRACSECHRREAEGLQRAGAARPFPHEGHVEDLSANTPTAACVSCHANVAETTSSAFVFAFHQKAAKEAGSCTAVCHQSQKMEVAAVPEDVKVPVFSHAQHASQPCATCHVGPSGVTALRTSVLGQPRRGEPADAFSCARCHGHKDPEKVKITGGYETTKETNTCFQCHVQKQDDQFAKEVRREQRFQLVGGVRQFHEKGGDCRKCHSYDDPQRVAASAPVRIVARRNLHASHTVNVGGTERTLPAVEASKDCLSCHAWQPRGL